MVTDPKLTQELKKDREFRSLVSELRTISAIDRRYSWLPSAVGISLPHWIDDLYSILWHEHGLTMEDVDVLRSQLLDSTAVLKGRV